MTAIKIVLLYFIYFFGLYFLICLPLSYIFNYTYQEFLKSPNAFPVYSICFGWWISLIMIPEDLRKKFLNE